MELEHTHTHIYIYIIRVKLLQQDKVDSLILCKNLKDVSDKLLKTFLDNNLPNYSGSQKTSVMILGVLRLHNTGFKVIFILEQKYSLQKMASFQA